MIAGAGDAGSGDVLIGGARLAGDAGSEKATIGLVPQDLALYDELTARANLRFFGALYGLSGRALDEAIARRSSSSGSRIARAIGSRRTAAA